MATYGHQGGGWMNDDQRSATKDAAESVSKEELTERFYLVREQRNKLLLASQKALAAYDAANETGNANWSGKDVDEMRAAVWGCQNHETDNAEEVDSDWLLSVGFTGGNDEPDVDFYDRQCGVGAGGPIIRVVIRYSRSEQVASHLILAWNHHYGAGPGRVCLHFEITDYPTRGEVRRLMDALGIEESRKEAS